MVSSLARWQYSTKKLLRSKTFWYYIVALATLLSLVRFLSKRGSRNGSQQYAPLVAPPSQPQKSDDGIDWTRFAYCQYVTDIEYLCNSLMFFESLHRLGSKADRLMLYPHYWELYPKVETWQSRFLKKAQKEYKVHVVPVRVQHFENGEPTWADSFTKLLAFKQTQYERVLSIDSDATLLQPLDNLFLLPQTNVAAPQAYWLGNETLTSAIMLIEPSQTEFKRVLNAMQNATSADADMDIINDLYYGEAMILPNDHWVISGEFRRNTHEGYLSPGASWDAEQIMKQVQVVHFSDWPYPKPWFPVSDELLEATTPACKYIPGSAEKDCKDRDAWLWLYADFRKRRKGVCGDVFTLY